MVEAVILEDVVVEVMVVTKTAEVMGKLEPLHHNMVGSMDRQTIGPIVTLSLGSLKRRHLMLSSQVIFWFGRSTNAREECDCLCFKAIKGA